MKRTHLPKRFKSITSIVTVLQLKIPPTPEMVVQGIHSKPEILLQYIRGFTIVPKQVELEALKSWLPSRSWLQPYTKSFYKFVTYYMIDHNYNIDP